MGRALCRFDLAVASIGCWESDVAETDVVFRVEQSGWSWLFTGIRPALLSQPLQTAGLQLGSIEPNPNPTPICARCRYGPY